MAVASWDEYGAPGTSRIAFAQHLCAGLGVGNYSARENAPMFVLAWIAKEGMRPETNNPLATTMRAPGSTPLPGNSAGVQQYGDLDTALALYHKNLTTNPIYAKLVEALKGDSMADMARALQSSGWCGGPKAPCPGYGGSVLAIATGYKGSDAKFKAAALKPAGTKFQNTSPAGLDAGGAIPDHVPVVDDAASAISELGSIAGWLVNPHNWQRIGLVAGGAGLALVGLALIKHDTLAQAGKALASGSIAAAAL